VGSDPHFRWPTEECGIYPFVYSRYVGKNGVVEYTMEPLFHLGDRWAAIRESISKMGGIRHLLTHPAWMPFFQVILELISLEDMKKIVPHCETCSCRLDAPDDVNV
jgi:hypothetical protein